MFGKATHRGAQCTARKARLLIGLVVGQTVSRALAALAVERRAGSMAAIKLIRSAAAQLPEFARSSAVIEQFVVDEGPKRRMFMPRAQGRATPVFKKTSHMTVHLKAQV